MMNLRTEQLRTLLGALVLGCIIAAGTAFATQPACTGDRHYDEAGQCCPVQPEPVECPEPTECEPVLPCPVLQCPPVTCEATCQDGEDGKAAPPVIVYVENVKPEPLEFCKVRHNGLTICTRAKRRGEGRTGARKILVPRSIIDQIADRQRP